MNATTPKTITIVKQASKRAAQTDKSATALQSTSSDWERATDYKLARFALLQSMARGRKNAADDMLYQYVKDNHDSSYATLSLDAERKIAYSRDDVHKYDFKRRVRVKLSKWLTRIAKESGATEQQERGAEEQVDKYARRIAIGAPGQERFEVVRGEELISAYLDNFGARSCMSGSNAEDYLQLYVDNPDKVSLLKYDDGLTQCRALLWTANCGTTLLDRMYPTSGEHVDTIRQWCFDNGYLVREHNGFPDDTTYFKDNDGDESSNYLATLSCDDSQCFPYCDSFHWCDDGVRNNSITLSTSRNCDTQYALSSTCGELIGQRCCYGCDGVLDDDSRSHNGDEYCESCFDETFQYCEDTGEYHETDDCVFVEQGHYVYESYYRCERSCCGEYHDNDNVGGEHDGRMYCESCWDFISDAQGALDDAQSEESDAQDALDDAQGALDDAQSEESDAQDALDDAQSALDDAQSAESDAQDALDDAQGALDDAQSAESDAQCALDEATS